MGRRLFNANIPTHNMLGHLGGVVIVAMALLRTQRAVSLLAGLYILIFVAITVYGAI
jgi:TRAP-type C4-dicarboxylate transport system permease small subunit